MPTSASRTSNILNNHQGFSLLEILVAIALGALVFLAVSTSDNVQSHRDLQNAVQNIDRSIQFASNEAILRNTVVRLRISLDKSPQEYTVEYGPAGNLPLPEMNENSQASLAEEKAMEEKISKLSKQFTKVEEFEDIKQEIPGEVSIIGVASSTQKGIIKKGEANIYFYPTGEKDGALVFFSTNEEFAFLEVAPFLAKSRNVFQVLDSSSVAKLDDILQTKMDEVYREWGP